MSDEAGKPRQKAAKKLRDQQIIAMSASGMKAKEISEAVGLGRHRISEILNSGDAKALVKYGQDRLKGLVDKALQTVEDAMDQKQGDNPQWNTALTAAMNVLKNAGIYQEKIDLTHQFPQPTIIEKSDGTKVVLGVGGDKD